MSSKAKRSNIQMYQHQKLSATSQDHEDEISDMDDEKKEEARKYQVYVGIDFGTDGCGLSYGLNSGEIFIHNRFKDACPVDEKPETSILFDNEGNPKAYGSRAKQTFIDLQDVNDWMLFEKYKMNLYTEPEWKSKIRGKDSKEQPDKVGLFDQVTAHNNTKHCSTEKIIVAQLKYLYGEAMKFMLEEFKRKRGMKIKSKDIQWILTVPAIWNDAAKNKMKQYAKRAGLVKGDADPDALKIVYEPDCASLSIQHALMRSLQRLRNEQEEKPNVEEKEKESENDNDQNVEEAVPHRPQISISEQFKEGDKYILVDVGGGTADIACHRIMGRFEIEELLHPTGGKWGAAYIDEAFISLLNRIFGKERIDDFKKQNQAMYYQLMNNYKYDAKKTFWADHIQRDDHHVQVPRNFVEYLMDQLRPNSGQISTAPSITGIDADDMADAFDAYENDEEMDGNDTEPFEYVREFLKRRSAEMYGEENMIMIHPLKFNTYHMSFKNRIWQEMFDVIIDPLIEHLCNILRDNIMADTNYIFLVGGFAGSIYFQQRIKNVFHTTPYNIKVVIPELPSLCVVDGAARYGITPNFMKVRKLALTYGIQAARSLEVLNPDDFPKGYIETHSTHSDITNKTIVRGCFYKFAEKNKAICLDDKPIKKSFSKLSKSCNTIDIAIYTSDKWNPATCSPEEAQKIGSCQLKFTDEADDTKIVVEFSYNDTTLRVFAYPEDRPEKKKEIEVNYY